ncbi:MAG: DUF899 family protein [Alphaproteobacteria bacterium]|nr:DUF899 family protein [Alphaproteobacteria bacterium]
MGRLHERRFPGESDAYRDARDRLLDAEMDLRKRVEAVAALRRSLPAGGQLKEDYVFDAASLDQTGEATTGRIKFSDLFEGDKKSLVLYSFMFAPGAELPCPACSSLMDSLNGGTPHLRSRINFAVVAKAPIDKFMDWAAQRGWRNLRLLSSNGNSYNTDYHGESPEAGQLPAVNVFQKTDDGIHHTYNAELLYAPNEDGQHPRHVDFIWPLWSVFDLTPEGRGTDWFPRLSYD